MTIRAPWHHPAFATGVLTVSLACGIVLVLGGTNALAESLVQAFR